MRAAFDESIKIKSQYEQLIIALMGQDFETRAKVESVMEKMVAVPLPTTNRKTSKAKNEVAFKPWDTNTDNRTKASSIKVSKLRKLSTDVTLIKKHQTYESLDQVSTIGNSKKKNSRKFSAKQLSSKGKKNV